jgi:membrane-bound lytic murein transglycosylase B
VRPAALSALLLLALAQGAEADYRDHPKTAELHQRLVRDYGFSEADLAKVDEALAQAEQLPQLIQAERQNKETTSVYWDDYRALHVFPKQAERGLQLLQDYAPYFERAEAEYGVPPPVIAAVMGVETKYGSYTGKHRVLDALVTQGYEHPTRQPFFFGELAAYFAFCRNFGFEPTAVKGSYAGAVGAAQFMPSNYLNLAVDYDGDGRVDLWSIPDAIGSIARYFNNYLPPDRPAMHWRRGEPLLAPVRSVNLAGDAPERNLRKPNATIAGWRQFGVESAAELSADLPAGLVELPRPNGPEYWLALPNFYAVMSYNPRIFYAMAVTQLAAELQQAQTGS